MFFPLLWGRKYDSVGFFLKLYFFEIGFLETTRLTDMSSESIVFIEIDRIPGMWGLP